MHVWLQTRAVGTQYGIVINLPMLTVSATLPQLIACLHEHLGMLAEQYCLFPANLLGTKLMYLILY